MLRYGLRYAAILERSEGCTRLHPPLSRDFARVGTLISLINVPPYIFDDLGLYYPLIFDDPPMHPKS